MSGSVRPEIQTFLDRFFSKPNLLNPESKPEIRHWIDRLILPEPLATVVPCWCEGKVIDWYGLAFDARQLRELGESLTAFVGPTYTTFRGQLARLDPADPIEARQCILETARRVHFVSVPGRGIVCEEQAFMANHVLFQQDRRILG